LASSEQQHVGGPVRREVIDDGKDLFGFRSYPGIDRLEEVHPGKPWCAPGRAA
jgi:hypothetical protein